MLQKQSLLQQLAKEKDEAQRKLLVGGKFVRNTAVCKCLRVWGRIQCIL